MNQPNINLQKPLALKLICLIRSFFISSFFSNVHWQSQRNSKPNMAHIIAYDLGYSAITKYGIKKVLTPNRSFVYSGVHYLKDKGYGTAIVGKRDCGKGNDRKLENARKIKNQTEDPFFMCLEAINRIGIS